MTAVSAWVKLALDIGWAWVSLSVMRSIYRPPGSYWVYVNRTMQVTHPFTEFRTHSDSPIRRWLLSPLM